MRKILLLLTLSLCCTWASAEVLRGIVRCASTGEPLPGAVVRLQECNLYASTNSEGVYILRNVPAGRYTFEISSVGYRSHLQKALLVQGNHDVKLDVELVEEPLWIEGIEVTKNVNKFEGCNPLAIMGVRRMPIEETQRIAGSFEDPMRTASVTPGVSGQVGDNGLCIHGNPPSTVRYHIEGADIPSPNHFADAMGYGGSFVSSMKTIMLSDWDLYTSVPPAEYGNTMGGVLDYHLRAGNNRKGEYSLKAGVLGFEGMAEGPIGKKGASYLVDYRYALTSLAYDMGLVLLNDEMFDFQDYNFKLQIPTRNGGTLSVWSLGQFSDHYWTLTNRENAHDVEDLHDQDCKQFLYMGGINQDQPLKNGWRLRWSAVASGFRNDNNDSYYARPQSEKQVCFYEDQQITHRATVEASLQHRLNRHVLLKGGGQYSQFLFDFRFGRRQTLFDPLLVIRQDGRHAIGLGHAYLESLIESGKWSFNLGAALEGMTNHTDWELEPRLNAVFQATEKQSLSLGYARTRMMPSLDNIFYRDEQYADMGDGEKLSMMGSNQLSVNYRWQPREGLSLSAEAYYEHLDHLPVGVVDRTYCALNRFLFDQSQPLVSQGKGRNYGIVLGVDQYMRNGFYYMLNAMAYDNQWKGLDDEWLNTRQNRNWKISGVVGMERMVGRKHDVLCLNASVNVMGGLHDTPVLLKETRENYFNGIPYAVYDNTLAMSQQYRPTTLLNISATYRINRNRRFSQLVGFEWMNVLVQGETWTQRYDFKQDNVVDVITMTSLPNLYYQIDF